jgi:hypothetical protein
MLSNADKKKLLSNFNPIGGIYKVDGIKNWMKYLLFKTKLPNKVGVILSY